MSNIEDGAVAGCECNWQTAAGQLASNSVGERKRNGCTPRGVGGVRRNEAPPPKMIGEGGRAHFDAKAEQSSRHTSHGWSSSRRHPLALARVVLEIGSCQPSVICDGSPTRSLCEACTGHTSTSTSTGTSSSVRDFVMSRGPGCLGHVLCSGQMIWERGREREERGMSRRPRERSATRAAPPYRTVPYLPTYLAAARCDSMVTITCLRPFHASSQRAVFTTATILPRPTGAKASLPACQPR